MLENTARNKEPIPFVVVRKERKFKKDGGVKLTKSNKESGRSSEVYPLKSEDEIERVMEVLDQKIEEAHERLEKAYGSTTNPAKRLKNAYRNKLVWIVGMNIGIRAGDLLKLKWSFFFDMDNDGKLIWHDFYSLQPEKQRKQRKFVKLYFNNALKRAVENYLRMYPITQKEIDNFMFMSDRGHPISTQQLWNIVCSTCEEAGIAQNVGTHTLRKTWAYHCWHNADDKNKALIILQRCFNHATTQTTMAYIGILAEDIEDMYMSVELGG